MVALAKAFEHGDLQFIETVNNVSFGYKAELSRKQKEKCTEDM